MSDWPATRTAAAGGIFRLVIGAPSGRGDLRDVTVFRNAVTSCDNYSSGDPFGDSTAQFTFGAISALDDFSTAELAWCQLFAQVNLHWVPAVPYAPQYAAYPKVLDANGNPTLVCPPYLLDAGGARLARNDVRIWEGFIASMQFPSASSLQISCQGALYQADHYLQKPFYPTQPWPLEKLIADVFSHVRKPHLRTQELTDRYVQFPAGWTDVVPPFTTQTLFTPVAKPGTKWTGYTSRATGAWDHALTGFVQDQLTVMITSIDQGVRSGNQWTLQQLRLGEEGNPTGRQPVLRIRDRFRDPDLQVWAAQPGVALELTADGTQVANVAYGEGTGLDGEVWRNAVISPDGSRTDYLPLAADAAVYPADAVNVANRWHHFVSESYTKFAPGLSQAQATMSAQQLLRRSQTPGWTGTVTLSVDPRTPAGAVVPRWTIHAGVTLLLQGFAGSGARGVRFHVSAVEANPAEGSVQLTVDTRYRDLLSLDEAMARSRDPLTPVKMLQVNRASVTIEDIQAPWDYTAGSGYVPHGSLHLYDEMPVADVFPYASWTQARPPAAHPGAYVRCNAQAAASRDRWSTPIPILTSEKGTISHTQFAVYDVHGNVLDCPFHVSIYANYVTVDDMPHAGTDYSPWRDGAFESINPATGQPWPGNSENIPDNSLLVGWGNKAGGVLNRAGFSPGSEAAGNQPTGLLVDDAGWNFDNTQTGNKDYNVNALPGQRQRASAITLYAAFYAEWPEPVYFLGRLFRANPGVS